MHRIQTSNRNWPILCALCLLCLGWVFPVNADEPLAKLRYPLSRSEGIRTPNFVLDLSEVADNDAAKAWGAEAKTHCEEWFPVLCRYLSTEKWTPPETVRLVLKKELDAPGITHGSTIEFSVKWIAQRPDDFGMVIHELTHVVQAYPGGRTTPGWLTEGIADYIRYWKYEPETARPRIDPKASHYRQGYGTTGAFLAWMVQKYDRRIVLRLDGALRTQTYKPELFREWTGKDLDELWAEFVAQVPQA